MRRYLLPLALFAALVAALAVGLRLKPRELPSALIGKPAPAFSLPQLQEPQRRLSAAELRGKVWLLNVWASWCAACREEHEVLLELAQSRRVPIYGLNYKDARQPAMAWLDRFGDPYAASIADLDGRVGIDYGVYGVPETFVIDGEGRIRHRHVGAVTREALRTQILPLLDGLAR